MRHDSINYIRVNKVSEGRRLKLFQTILDFFLGCKFQEILKSVPLVVVYVNWQLMVLFILISQICFVFIYWLFLRGWLGRWLIRSRTSTWFHWRLPLDWLLNDDFVVKSTCSILRAVSVRVTVIWGRRTHLSRLSSVFINVRLYFTAPRNRYGLTAFTSRIRIHRSQERHFFRRCCKGRVHLIFVLVINWYLLFPSIYTITSLICAVGLHIYFTSFAERFRWYFFSGCGGRLLIIIRKLVVFLFFFVHFLFHLKNSS